MGRDLPYRSGSVSTGTFSTARTHRWRTSCVRSGKAAFWEPGTRTTSSRSSIPGRTAMSRSSARPSSARRTTMTALRALWARSRRRGSSCRAKPTCTSPCVFAARSDDQDDALMLDAQPEDSEIEMSLMKNGSRLVVIDTVWGHMGTSSDHSYGHCSIKRFSPPSRWWI